MIVDRVDILESDNSFTLEDYICRSLKKNKDLYALVDIKFSTYFRTSKEYYCVLILWKLK